MPNPNWLGARSMPATPESQRGRAQPWTSSPVAAWSQCDTGADAIPFQKLAFYCALALVFIRYSSIHEFLAYTLHVRPFLVAILTPVSIGLVVLSGGLRRTFSTRTARYWLGILIWLVLATFSSVWKSDSMAVVLNYARVEFSLLVVIAGSVVTLSECMTLMRVMALASAASVAFGFFFRQSGRLALDFGIMANSNDLAAHLLATLPFLLFVFATSGLSVARRIFAVTVSLAGLFLVVETASRGALLAILISLGFCFLRTSGVRRLAMAVALPLLVVIVLPSLPSRTIERWSTLIRGGEQRDDSEAEASSEARKRLLQASIHLTLTHPIFGVGPGEFSVAQAAEAKEANTRGLWQVTHNSYTQVSSEAGIPPLLMLIAALVSTYRHLNRIYREARGRPEQSTLSSAVFCVMLSMIAFCTCAMFLSLFYRFYLPAFSGLAIAFSSAWERRRAAGCSGMPPMQPR